MKPSLSLLSAALALDKHKNDKPRVSKSKEDIYTTFHNIQSSRIHANSTKGIKNA
ncbi:hypothetical protein Scep_006575 [Stephania cephalantha]|uniref:Uncharacterized protein n=1 Tax=Stephania cephalantha TaxID=152367 RepID=A0AAP0PK77_9MAGN